MRIGNYSTSIGDISIRTLGEVLYTVDFGNVQQVTALEPSSIIVGKVILAIEQGRDYDESIHVLGTKFQESVWRAIRKIPYGKTASYKEIAEHIGKPKSIRAVANACGANSIAVIIPCHRVIKANGDDSGYRWGVDIKRKLLDREYNITHPMTVEY